MKRFKLALVLTALAIPVAGIAGQAPTIGGGASISVSIGKAGVVNAGGAAGGATLTLKQSVGAVLSGNIGGKLNLSVNVGEAGVVNVGGGAENATVTACQSIGTVGSDC